MKKFLKKLGRVLFFLTFAFFVIASVATSSLLILKNNDYLKALDSYNQIKSQLDDSSKGLSQSNADKQAQIDQLNSQLSTLKASNSELQSTLDSLQKSGDGIIQGKITGQIILGQDNLSQYQLICAKSVTDVNKIYCKSVSAINQNFEIALPAGQYTVYAKVLDKDNNIVLNQYSGKYTEYVKCLTEKANGGCDISLSQKQITIDVKPTQKIVNINPVDWN